jgi:GNAT superfamily N-acetyltransferase
VPTIRRAYRAPHDLPELLLFAQRCWNPDSRWHVGDFAWEFGLAPEGEPGWQMALWSLYAEIVGWGWLRTVDDGSRPGNLSLLVDPRFAGLTDEVIDWAIERAGPSTTVTVVDTETAQVEVLVRRGYTPEEGGHFFLNMQRGLDFLPPVPALPDGYAIRPVGRDDLRARAAVHRAVWSSPLPDAVYEAMTLRRPYRGEFDLVVTAPDGRFVSYILGWLDERNRVGEFEPVGTLASVRRRGLSRAVGVTLLRAFRDAGADRALVYARGDDGYPIPRQVYAAMGFRAHGRTVTYQPR